MNALKYGDWVRSESLGEDDLNRTMLLLFEQALQVFQAINRDVNQFSIEFYYRELDAPLVEGNITYTHKAGWVATVKSEFSEIPSHSVK